MTSEQLRTLQVHAQFCGTSGVLCSAPEEAQRHAGKCFASHGHDWELYVQILKRKGGQHEKARVLSSIPAHL